jgi:uncharacterized membrane protein
MLVVMPFVLPNSLPEAFTELESAHFIILALSGVIGIAVGDSAYFSALRRIGANKTLLLESLAPPLSGVLALIFLGTVIGIQSWLGIIVTTLAVTFVMFQPNSDQTKTSLSGIFYGLLASVCQATGVVISHFALVAGDIDPLMGAFIRLAIGVASVMIFMALIQRHKLTSIIGLLKSMASKEKTWLLGAIFIGTFLALWLQQVSLKHANPAVAQTLIATSPLFMLVIYTVKGQKLSAKSIIGTVVAIMGVSLFFL